MAFVGAGSFTIFPFTPGYSFTQGITYTTEIAEFDDRTEQRFLLADEREMLLTYVFDSVGSATAAGITSWFQGAGGPFLRFFVADHNNVSAAGVPTYYVARFADNELEHHLTAGLQHHIGPITFTIARSDEDIGWGGEGVWGWGEGGWGG